MVKTTRDNLGRFKQRTDIDSKMLEIIRLYNLGLSIQEIFKIMKCSQPVITRILKQNNIGIRDSSEYCKGRIPWNYINLEKERIINMYLGGNSVKKISKLFDVACSTIYRILNKNKVLLKDTKLNLILSREKRRENRAFQIFPMRDTFIELKAQNFLKQLNIEFLAHHYVSEITHAYQCDILINPQPNFMAEKRTVLELDGDYWHGNPIKFPNPNKMQKEQIEEDTCRNEELRATGFNVIRLWESDIKKMNLEDFRNILISKLNLQEVKNE